jgi:hypothetical protein
MPTAGWKKEERSGHLAGNAEETGTDAARTRLQYDSEPESEQWSYGRV